MADTIPRPFFAEALPPMPLEPDSEALPRREIEAWARHVEKGISEDPERYERALAALGEAATSGDTRSLLTLEADLSPEDMGAAINMHTYFSLMCDKNVMYDDASENALTLDQDYRAALAAHKKAHSRTITVSSQAHKQVSDPNSSAARDAVRRRSLAFYITRALQWQSQEALESMHR